MAKLEQDSLLRALAYGATGVLITIIGLVLWDGMQTDREHAMRLTAVENIQAIQLSEINRRLGVIERELSDDR